MYLGLPSDSVVKNPPVNAGDIRDMGSISGSGRSLGGGNGNLLQYSCLENPKDRGAWGATVHGVARVGHDSVTKQQETMVRQFLFETIVYPFKKVMALCMDL